LMTCRHIAGCMQVSSSRTRQAFALKSTLLLLGTLFSSSSTQVQRRERLFLIRPTVLGNQPRTAPPLASQPPGPATPAPQLPAGRPATGIPPTKAPSPAVLGG